MPVISAPGRFPLPAMVWSGLAVVGLLASQPAVLLAQSTDSIDAPDGPNAPAQERESDQESDRASSVGQENGAPARPTREAPVFQRQPAEAELGASSGWQEVIARNRMGVFIILLAVLVVLGIVVWWMFGKSRSQSGYEQHSSRRRSAGGAMDGAPGQTQAYAKHQGFGQGTMTYEELVDKVVRMERQIQMLHERIGRLEGPSSTGSSYGQSSTSNQLAGREYSSLDRRAERVSLPDDDTPSAYRGAPPPHRPAVAGSADNGAYGRSIDAQAVVENYNRTVKPGDLANLAEALNAEYYTNERSGDISALFKSDVDRFWLIPNPQRPDEALLIPGFTIRKSWQKYRQVASDHPLVHHFDLQRGEKFHVNRAALLRRDSNGEWQLVEKGEVSGIS